MTARPDRECYEIFSHADCIRGLSFPRPRRYYHSRVLFDNTH